MTADAGSSISPSKPGSKGRNTTTLNFSLLAAALRIREMSACAIWFSTDEPALQLMKN
jgi:hypothetical protein